MSIHQEGWTICHGLKAENLLSSLHKSDEGEKTQKVQNENGPVNVKSASFASKPPHHFDFSD